MTNKKQDHCNNLYDISIFNISCVFLTSCIRNVMTKTPLLIRTIILSLVSFVSIISSTYVCFSILYNGYLSCGSLLMRYKSNSNMHYKYKHSLMTITIFWICATDAIIGLKCLLSFTPQIFVNPKRWFYDGSDGIMCRILAIGDIFFRIQNSLWHIILAYNFLYILRLKSLENLLKYQKWLYLIVIAVRLLSLDIF